MLLRPAMTRLLRAGWTSTAAPRWHPVSPFVFDGASSSISSNRAQSCEVANRGLAISAPLAGKTTCLAFTGAKDVPGHQLIEEQDKPEESIQYNRAYQAKKPWHRRLAP